MRIWVSSTFRVSFLFCFSPSCVPYVGSFSGLSILNAPSVFSNVYLDYQKWPSYNHGMTLAAIYYECIDGIVQWMNEYSLTIIFSATMYTCIAWWSTILEMLAWDRHNNVADINPYMRYACCVPDQHHAELFLKMRPRRVHRQTCRSLGQIS